MAQSVAERQKSFFLRNRFNALNESFVGATLCLAYAREGADVLQMSTLPWIRLSKVADLLPDMKVTDLADRLKETPYVRVNLRGFEPSVKVVTTPPRTGVLAHDSDVCDEIMMSLTGIAKNHATKSLREIENFERTELKRCIEEADTLTEADQIYLATVKAAIEEERERLIDILLHTEQQAVAVL